jgi:hypothetical protein
MANEDLTLEERNQLYKLCTIPMFITFCILLIYFVYLMQHTILQTSWDFLTKFGLPFAISIPLAGVISFEAFYYRKLKKPIRFHLRRGGLNASLVLVSVFSLFGFLLLTDAVLSPHLGGRAILIGAVLWTAIFFIIVTKYQRFLRKF